MHDLVVVASMQNFTAGISDYFSIQFIRVTNTVLARSGFAP